MSITETIPVAVLGATGYAGEISTRILLEHPRFLLVHVGSDRLAGTRLADAVPAFAGDTELVLGSDSPEILLGSGAKAIVLAKKSPEVTALVPQLLEHGIRLVDIGAEFRLRDSELYRRWYGGGHACPELLDQAVYGLSELNREAIREARVVGNPGCYPTSILLPLAPLVEAGLIDLSAPLVSASYSGVSGAGKRFAEGNNNLFWAVNENLHAYKALAHQHQAEIDQELSAAAGSAVHLRFVPHLAPITRGILSTISARLKDGADRNAIYACWQKAYVRSPFIRLRDEVQGVEVANVTGSNYADFAAAVDGDCVVICSAIDNLVKGAAGQAVQNLNIMFGMEERLGLQGRLF